jgi:hypothetical protein
VDKVIEKQMEESLVWLPEQEIGYFPVKNSVYDDKYFDEYVNREKTEIGRCLNIFRVNLVNKYVTGRVLDVGIGCGTFIGLRKNCVGYDINPKAVKFLKRARLFCNPYETDFEFEVIKGVTFFDSLEHLECPGKILSRIDKQFVFVSIPIFRGLDHLLSSKHLKRKEHFYYFTKGSFIVYMASFDFELLEIRDDEIKCGREDIYTFVFKKEV